VDASRAPLSEWLIRWREKDFAKSPPASIQPAIGAGVPGAAAAADLHLVARASEGISVWSLSDKTEVKADKKESEVHNRAQAVCFRLHYEMGA
jgi:hypothetical protein